MVYIIHCYFGPSSSPEVLPRHHGASLTDSGDLLNHPYT